ncbi:MAG: chlorophyll A-B-binding protein, partial [Cyanobacteria bacterium SW_9_47_5]
MNSEEQVASEDQSLIPQIEEPAFGWTPYAERINGRFAM